MSRSVLITGASSGIGAAAAQLLARSGFAVFGTSRRPRESHDGVRWIQMDVCDEGSVEKGVREMLAASGRIDGLVCNAGMGFFGSVEEVSIESARAQFETNYFGTLRTLRAALPDMRSAGRGRVVLVGSLAGRAPIPFQAHYSCSKAAVDALAMALRNEVAAFGISVSLVEPGDIRTAFNDHMRWEGPAASPYGARLRAAEQVVRESLPRAPGPEVVARAIRRALDARRPRARYTVGPDSLRVPLGRRLLPDWLTLWLIRSHFRI